MAKRFADLTDEDLQNLIRNKYAKNTHYNDNYAERLMTSFFAKKNFAYEGDKTALVLILKEFFASVRRQDGEDFRVTGILTIYHSVCRILKNLHNIDLKADLEFQSVREMLDCVKQNLKKQGKGSIQHTDVINGDDLVKIGDIAPSTPTLLQLKVWFSIQIHFARRAMENSHDLMKEDVIIEDDRQGRMFVKLTDKLTKNHRGNSTTASYGGTMISTGDENCPVSVIKFYMSHLCPANEYFWQRPKAKFSQQSPSFCDQKVGINKISNFMKDLSAAGKLSKMYTNHAVRATAISILGETFEDTDVVAVSGHKQLSSLTTYKRTSDEKKIQMSATIHGAMMGSSTTLHSVVDCPSTSYSNAQAHSEYHNQCCISGGASEPFQIPDINMDMIELDDLLFDVAPENSVHEPNNSLKDIGLSHQNILPKPKDEESLSSPKNHVKNSLMKISDKAFVIHGNNCVINFNVNVQK